MVNVATSPVTSARRSRRIRSTAWQRRQTRVGGRWRKPHASQRLASKPLFQGPERQVAGAPGRSGSGRRAGSRRMRPRQERKRV